MRIQQSNQKQSDQEAQEDFKNHNKSNVIEITSFKI